METIIAVAALAVSIVALCWAEQTRRVCKETLDRMIELNEEMLNKAMLK